MLNFKLFLEKNEIDTYTDEILDKISRSGMDSLTDYEKDFLNSHKTDNQQEILDSDKHTFKDEIHGIEIEFIYEKSNQTDPPFFLHYGTLIINAGGKEYSFKGSMSEYYGSFTTNFGNGEDWTLFEGLEHEYEQFLELVFGELEKSLI